MTDASESSPTLMQRLPKILGIGLLIAWATLFLAGALGDIFGIDALRDFADVKRIFLR